MTASGEEIEVNKESFAVINNDDIREYKNSQNSVDKVWNDNEILTAFSMLGTTKAAFSFSFSNPGLIRQD